jgi:hypothetical protein
MASSSGTKKRGRPKSGVMGVMIGALVPPLTITVYWPAAGEAVKASINFSGNAPNGLSVATGY